MRPVSHHARAAFLLGLILAGAAAAQRAQPQAPPVLTRVEQSRALSFAQAAKGYPVHLKGVITYIVPQAYRAFLADRTGGVYFDPQPGDQIDLASGDEVELTGKVAIGRSGPVVVNPRAVRIGHVQLPPGEPIGMRRLVDGTMDAQRVQIVAVVRSADPDGGLAGGLNLYSVKLGVEDLVVRFHAPAVPGDGTASSIPRSA